MNVFEDLVEELKDENLLESTFIEAAKDPSPFDQMPAPPVPAGSEQLLSADLVSATEPVSEAPESGFELADEDDGIDAVANAGGDVPQIAKAKDPNEFLRRRANEEVMGLQMVEHVLAGIEREHLKVVPSPYDDLGAKTALHRFLTSLDGGRTPQTAEAEYDLLQETQNWSASLAERDREISVANLRRFCENSRPPLSSQALIALARFYRNGPVTDLSIEKFEFVMTRLFSREDDRERRRLLFDRGDVVPHIRTLYENWSSVSLYSVSEHEEQILPLIAGLRECSEKAENSQTFDDLLRHGVFETVRNLKMNAGELMFVPEVLAAVIECNLRLGNRFMALAELARETERFEDLDTKFGNEIDQLVSSATGRTYLLREVFEKQNGGRDGRVKQTINIPNAPRFETASEKARAGFLSIKANKWLLLAAFLIISASVGVFVWSNYMEESAKPTIAAAEIDLAGTELRAHLRIGKTAGDTFYGVTEPTWDGLSEADRKDVLNKAYAFANERGFVKVNILNYRGRTVGFATADRLELFEP